MLLLVACGGDGAVRADTDDGSSSASGDESSIGSRSTTDRPTTAATDAGETGRDPSTSGAGSTSRSESTSTTGACIAEPIALEPAALPVDVVLAVDASGSMNLEMAAIGGQFPALFSELHALGSVRAALLAPYPDADPAGVCVGPPMGLDGCPSDDHNPPAYAHLPEAFPSFGILAGIVDTHAQWSADFRRGAPIHVIVVTDGDSALPADEFSEQLAALAPGYDQFIFHALIAPIDAFSGCAEDHACCMVSSEQGTVYETLVEETGGVTASICDLDATAFFAAVAASIATDAAPACHYALTDPPADPDLVSVFDDGRPLVHRDGPADCDDGGWYGLSDDIIALCPDTCEGSGSVTAEAAC